MPSHLTPEQIIGICDLPRDVPLQTPLDEGLLNSFDQMYGLKAGEKPWRDLYMFLLRRGYRLRPRYDPGWVPSWRCTTGPIYHPAEYKDSLPAIANIFHPKVLDGIRTSDGQKVVLKRVEIQDPELSIHRRLHHFATPASRIVPLLDVIGIPHTSEALLVTPLLSHFAHPHFRFRGEVMEAMQQFMEGLRFMHEHKVAHLDACYFNLMMDPTKVVPDGINFCGTYLHPDDSGRRDFRCKSRAAVTPVNYYLIDFSHSLYCPEGNDVFRGVHGQDKTVPELRKGERYDPFKVDIYLPGNMLKMLIVENYDGLDFLLPLADAMTERDPMRRPSAEDALRLLHQLKQGNSQNADVWRRNGGRPERRSLITRLFTWLTENLGWPTWYSC
ncbi:hypothetical protein C8R43DRAFT_196604 [Mycena crocata]|nr:hypothetical protein C8R43DRAFT_196604 [Mycena crocata]